MVRARNREREKAIREEMELRIFWECGIRRLLSENEKMQKFFADCPDTGAINLRDAFFGGLFNTLYISVKNNESGRTGPEWTRSTNQPGIAAIKYMDIMSIKNKKPAAT
jgi:hypothetical protein